MKYGLLGAFEVLLGDESVTVGSPKHRILLATLLLEPRRQVSRVDLAEAIWGSRRPEDPRRALQVCVARTRALLGPQAPIVTGTDGYQMDVDDDAVDVWSFRRCLKRADLAAARADVEDEWTALGEALKLWRGDVLADVPSDVLHRDYGHALTELRLQTVERQIDLSLRTGRQVEFINELGTLAAQHPLREKLWGQLMTVLHRSGRRADALMMFHTARRHLADELGVDPSDELKRLYMAVLRGDERADSATDPPAVPRQLPPQMPGFAGRTAQLEQMSLVLREHERVPASRATVLVVSGMPGVGKTAVAAHWSRSVANRFPDGQLWLNLRGHDRHEVVTPHAALASILPALRVPRREVPSDPDDRIALFRTLMDGRRILLVLDNAASVEHIHPLLPGGAGNLVVVTSRNELSALVAAEAASTLRLDPLTTGEARQMLRLRIGGGRVDAERDAVDRLIHRCGRLPLALAVAAARAAARPSFTLDALVQQLASAGQLDGLRSPDAMFDVRAAFSWSYDALTPAAARLFRLLSLHPIGAVCTPAAASLAGLPVSRARMLLAELAAAHLVVEYQPDRFVLHDLLHAYAEELVVAVDPADERAAGQRRLLRWLDRTTPQAGPPSLAGGRSRLPMLVGTGGE